MGYGESNLCECLQFFFGSDGETFPKILVTGNCNACKGPSATTGAERSPKAAGSGNGMAPVGVGSGEGLI
ncbi:hypothetical protein CMUS01_05447 [Colletotrichum musicola]|uniref:Uncharacterized protein n=1 Tax=Colletotrichum musicola TaxID=2175873 RepID=A0A8H6KSB0_9PEZI|nr:hypothetical protein CMUS01_05447 [Colletotrichum musicola]